MDWWQVVLIVVAAVVLVFIGLYFLSKKLQKKADGQQELINQSKITTSILIIDKKKMKIKDSNLPKIVQDQVPGYLKFRKMPLVKAKIGPKIQTLMCDERVFKELPVKKLVKVDIAGMYIIGIKGNIKGNAPTNTKEKKKRFGKTKKEKK
jgi:uncharacterized protein YneF (UPF0154 family)